MHHVARAVAGRGAVVVLGQHVRAPGQVGEQDATLVADGVRGDVLVGVGPLGDGRDVHAPLVGEGGVPDVRRAQVGLQVGALVDVAGQLAQLVQPLRLVEAELQRQVRHDRDQVRVAAPLAVAADRALHVAGARLHGGQRVRDAQLGVVVGVDPDRQVERRARRLDPACDPSGQGPTVRVAQHQAGGAAVGGRGQGGEGVVGIGAPAVVEVLGVVHDLAPLGDHPGDRVADHLQVLLQRRAQRLGDVQRPRLAEQRHDRRVRREQRREVGVVLGRLGAVPRAAERREPSALQRHVPHAGEELGVLRVGARPAALDQIDAERVEPLGDRDLVGAGEGEALPLGAVAEGGVVDLDARHRIRAFARRRVAASRWTVPGPRRAC